MASQKKCVKLRPSDDVKPFFWNWSRLFSAYLRNASETKISISQERNFTINSKMRVHPHVLHHLRSEKREGQRKPGEGEFNHCNRFVLE